MLYDEWRRYSELKDIYDLKFDKPFNMHRIKTFLYKLIEYAKDVEKIERRTDLSYDNILELGIIIENTLQDIEEEYKPNLLEDILKWMDRNGKSDEETCRLILNSTIGEEIDNCREYIFETLHDYRKERKEVR